MGTLRKLYLFIICAFIHNTAIASHYTVYLTFDDGPLGGTENILNTLEEEEVPASFFMVGMHVEQSDKQQKVLEKVQESIYVLLGNHSYSHAFGRYKEFYSNAENVMQDMKKNNKALALSKIVYSRLPGRNVFRLPNNLIYNDPFISKTQQEKEIPVYNIVFKDIFYLYGWDHEWEYKKNNEPLQTPEQLIREIDKYFLLNRTFLKDHLILLMHDQMFRDEHDGKENLQQFVRLLKQKGYKIANLHEYNNS